MTSEQLKEYIIKNDKVEYLLTDLGCHGIKYNESKEYWTASQPDGDNLTGVVIKNVPYLNYYSYSRNIDVTEHKDIFNLIQDVKKISFGEAIKYTHKLFGLKLTYNKPVTPEIQKTDPLAIFKKAAAKRRYCDVSDIQYLNENVLNDFVPMIHIDLFREGIIKKTIDKFGLCYSYKHKRTIIPIKFWLDGSLMGYNARTSIKDCEMLGIKKYFLTPGYQKQMNLYGLWENRESIEQAGYICVYEAEKSTLKRHSRNDETGVSLQGHSISQEQVRIILGLNIREVIICMDNDIREEEIWDMCEHFYHIRKVSYIYDKWDLLGQKESAADKDDKVYQFLFKHRIEYDESHHKKYIESLQRKE